MANDTASVLTDPHAAARGLWGAWTRITHTLRWPIIALWVLLTVGAVLNPPSALTESDGLTAAFLMSPTGPAVTSEVREMEIFGFPLFSRTVVVQRDPNGLSPEVQVESVLDALALDQKQPTNAPS